MISIARRNLLTEKTRFAISAGGVAFSVMLILVILSLYQGWQIKSTQYIQEIDTDIWVAQNGAEDISSSASVIPSIISSQLQEIEGVEKVSRFVGRPLQFKINGEVVQDYLVGVDADNPIAGPKNIVDGRGNPKEGEIVLDRVLARKNKVAIGDLIEVFNKSFRVVGIADGANMFLFQFSFIDQKEAAELFNIGDAATYYLVKTDGAEIDNVVSTINKIDGVEAFPKEKFLKDNKRLIQDVFVPMVLVLVVISILVGTAVIGLTIYTVTLEKTREFGVLKALGASNRQIYRIIFEQALISGLVGYSFGVALTFFVLWLVPNFVPVFITLTRIEDMVLVGAISIAMSLVASYVPVHRIIRIDPAIVFKS